MIHIGKIRVKLPTEYSKSSTLVTQHLKTLLNDWQGGDRVDIKHLKIGPLQMKPGSSSRMVAKEIARHIFDSTKREV